MEEEGGGIGGGGGGGVGEGEGEGGWGERDAVFLKCIVLANRGEGRIYPYNRGCIR